jgi:uncharacterized protein (UPF0332 family)
MNERDFLTLAQSLVGQPTEVAWRTAVSRAYYGAFHVARRLLEDLRFGVPHADRAHGYLWLRLSNCGDPTVQRAGADLNRLRRLRNEADYDLGRPLTQASARSQVQTAAAVVNTLDAARTEPTRTRITDEMKRYERDVLHDITWHP